MSQFTNLKLMLRRYQRKIEHYYKFNLRPYVDSYIRHQPSVIIYQIGKVGSTSIVHSLVPHVPRPIYSVHKMLPATVDIAHASYRERGLSVPPHLALGKRLHKYVIKRQQPVKIITLTRDPIARSISDFFQNYTVLTGEIFEQDRFTVEQTIELFYQYGGIESSINWFETEFIPALDLNIYDYPFPHEQGYQRIQQGAIDLLILRVETEDDVIVSALRDFFDQPEITMKYANVGSVKGYSETYKAVRQQIQLPPEIVDKMLNSPYTTHFYSDEERTAMRQKWLRS